MVGLDKPPHCRVKHKMWKKQLADNTRQLRLGVDRAMRKIELEMLDGTDAVRVVKVARVEPVAEGRVWMRADAESTAALGR